ncbi:hypothetical protein D7W82_37405 [Corallococcus sp. CA049B]|uniref:hypothetical protein n=1 Tax=Corallococcus sp. CA049B TaxID=2316730 RepID=UPI000EA3E25B|nr:hypothetical protein [Corallococcus sp. CA049B]RKG74882.1 hypothetical protein D7W82_37405 [Corallococcus sp. CA049B]
MNRSQVSQPSAKWRTSSPSPPASASHHTVLSGATPRAFAFRPASASAASTNGCTSTWSVLFMRITASGHGLDGGTPGT